MDTVIGPPTQEHLLSRETQRTLVTSLYSFRKCCTHRYVLDKTKRCIKPVLGMAVGVYLAGLILFIPVQIVASLVHFFSFGRVDTSAVVSFCSSLLLEVTSLVPLICVLVLRSVIRKPLYKCFIHTLRDVNPTTAKAIESQPRIVNPDRKTWSQWATSYVSKTMQLLVLECVIYLWKQLPYVGIAADPVMHFLTMASALEPRRAIVLSALALAPYISPYVHSFVHLWRASYVLGEELLEDYVSHVIVHASRESFFKRRGVTITVFVMPQLLVMKIPILGPLAMLPMTASAAYLVDLLVSRGEATSRIHAEQRSVPPTLPTGGVDAQGYHMGQQAPAAAPTLPVSPPLQGYAQRPPQQGVPYAKAGSFGNASAPPWPADTVPLQ